MKSIFLGILLLTPLSAKPNIIYIITDDMGYGDLSCYGQKNFKTPHIDKLAASGIRFTRHYSGATVCAPSRCSLMTGKDGGHAAIRGNGPFELPAEETNVAAIAQKAGYNMAMIGKSCVTGDTQTPETVLARGFGFFYGTTSHRDGHFRYPEFIYRNTEKIEFPGNKLHTGTDYDADLYTKEALGYIAEQKAEKPFFMILSYPIPHASVVATDEALQKARPLVADEVGLKKSGHYTATPEVKANYIGMMTILDDAVGSLVARLDEQGLLDDTLIMLTSDNGPHFEGGYRPELLDSNGPLRGGKRDLYEGGIRVPFIASWPAAIKAGGTTAHPSAFWDFLPTVCDLTGQPLPEGIQGISFLPTLTGKGEQAKHPHLYWEFHEQGIRRAIQSGDWKLVQYNLSKPAATTTELYDLGKDIGEGNDLSDGNPEKVAELLKLMSTARKPVADFPVQSLD
ncbi:arylsulfatase [Akkermansiaceae bacterium]|nr:arylsulfatase [Akkermansiaceae bacterium]